MRLLRALACVAILAFISLPVDARAERIRVLVMEGLPKLTIRFPETLAVVDETAGVVSADKTGANVIELGPDTRVDGGIRVRADGYVITINEYSLTGNIDIRKSKKGAYSIVNELDVEDYVRAVVGEEMDYRWPVEALKAQAVAARTYALYRKNKAACGEYDLCSTTSSQMFTGDARYKEGPAIAVEATKGLVLALDGSIVETVYSSCCGGRTESAGDIWDSKSVYLKSVDCVCVPGTPYDQWTRTTSADRVSNALAAIGYAAPGIKGIGVTKRSASGRAKTVKVETEKGSVEIKGAELRRGLGYRELPSTYFVVNKTNGGFMFTGSGSGHGVGMCQWGAKKMADDGKKYYEILAHYYPGLTLSRIKDGEDSGF